ncbi:MAG: hypothetical protein CMN30_22290 [Sandaracinus sp.]|nr:hypothetical protein [Sandaracinus sp.]
MGPFGSEADHERRPRSGRAQGAAGKRELTAHGANEIEVSGIVQGAAKHRCVVAIDDLKRVVGEALTDQTDVDTRAADEGDEQRGCGAERETSHRWSIADMRAP